MHAQPMLAVPIALVDLYQRGIELQAYRNESRYADIYLATMRHIHDTAFAYYQDPYPAHAFIDAIIEGRTVAFFVYQEPLH